MSDRLDLTPTGRRSRRAALSAGGAFALALAALAPRRVVAHDATPSAGASGAGSLLVQGFGHGSLFRTQGSDPGLPPYTLILWDADGGFFVADRTSGAAGVVPADQVLAAMGRAAAPPNAALVAQPTREGGPTPPNEAVWALTLVYGGRGSDPGAVTYQGEVLDPAAATAQLGTPPSAPPRGVENLGTGYLIITGLPGLDAGGGAVRLALP